MSATGLQASQLALARYLRNPAQVPAPEGVEQRRLNIYRRLVYNNIESFISSGFPVLRSLYADDDWHSLVRSFVERHSCHTPYFLEISQEFLQFLLEEYSRRPADPVFMAELAHYEWVELALDVSTAEPPAQMEYGDLLAAVPQLSPLAWLLSYRYPVHRIGPAYRPAEPGEATYLVVYRDRGERVRFMELNAVSARLVELTRGNVTATAGALLAQLAGETGLEQAALLESGATQLRELLDCAVLGLAPAAAVSASPVAPSSR